MALSTIEKAETAAELNALMAEERPTPTDHFTARGTHEGCGECCSRFLPMRPHEAVRLRMAALAAGWREEPGDVLDMTCPLLTDDKLCSVYDARPAICRAYSCAEHARGDFRAMHAAMPEGSAGTRLYDVRELLEQPRMRELSERLDGEWTERDRLREAAMERIGWTGGPDA